ncbi:hypothetical protein Dimus_001481 [Dionaea muscipula]
MTVIHLKKKDVVKSSVKGISIEFDHERLVAILDVLEELEFVNTSRRYGKSQGSGENRRRDDDEATPEEEAEGDDEGNKDDFDWEAAIDEATDEGESESDDQFYDAQVGKKSQVTKHQEDSAISASSSAQQKDQEPAGVDPSGLTGRDAEFLKFQAEFERKRANRFHDELEKAKAENAKLLALLHKTQTKPHP